MAAAADRVTLRRPTTRRRASSFRAPPLPKGDLPHDPTASARAARPVRAFFAGHVRVAVAKPRRHVSHATVVAARAGAHRPVRAPSTSVRRTPTAARRRRAASTAPGSRASSTPTSGSSLPHWSGSQYASAGASRAQDCAPATSSSSTGVGHVGIYIGGGRFIHAPHTGTRVAIESLAGWYSARYDGARRLV